MALSTLPSHRVSTAVVAMSRNAGMGSSRSEFLWRASALLAIVAAIFFAWKLASIILLTFGGMVLAVVVHLGAAAVTKVLPIRERWAAIIVVLVLAVALAAVVYFFGSELAAQLGTLYSAMASGWEQSQAWLGQSGLGSDWLS